MSRNTAEDIARDATAAFNSGQPDRARRQCEEGLNRWPGEPVLHHLLASVLFSKGEIELAGKHVEASLARRPDNTAARLLAARIARTAGNIGAALALLDEVITASPSREAFLEKARTLDQASLSQKSIREQAREAWRFILKVIPQSQEAAARLGRLAWEDGDHAAALPLLEHATAGDAPASAWFDLGIVRQDLRNYVGAATAYRRAFEAKPEFAEAALNLGVVLQENGDIDSAMHAYAQAYRLRPQTFGTIAMALTSAPHGRLWIDEAALRRSLGDRSVRL